MISEALGEGIAHLVIERKIIRIRADHDEAAVRLPAVSEIFDKIVAFVKNTGKMHACRHIVIAGTAGHKQNHKITCPGKDKRHYSVLF